MNKIYLSFKEVVNEYPFTPGALREFLLHRRINGLDAAVLKRKRAIFFHRKRFEHWLETSFAERRSDNRSRRK